MHIAVSGTIGAGKSTLCGQLAEATSFELFAEPVESNPYLDDFYSAPGRWAFSAQVFMISHRFRIQMQAAHAENGTGFILDRCFHEDCIFAEVNHQMGHINERDWETYTHLYESFCRVVPPPEVVVYLRTSPEVAMERIMKRNRAVESDLKLEYLCLLHEAYEKWTRQMSAKVKVLTVDWDEFDLPGLKGVLSMLRHEGMVPDE